jgi:hypothetical protein
MMAERSFAEIATTRLAPPVATFSTSPTVPPWRLRGERPSPVDPIRLTVVSAAQYSSPPSSGANQSLAMIPFTLP